MCEPQTINYATKVLRKEEIEGKRIIEVGAQDVNGSLRPLLESMDPKEYIGIDIFPGKGVDIVCDAKDIPEIFEKESFDVVICTAVLEHVKDWRKVVSNLKYVCKNGGMMFITVPSIGFHYHGYPFDFWRFEARDLQCIFSDCNIENLHVDKDLKGIFIKIKKPEDYVSNDLSNYKLYSIITNTRVIQIKDEDMDFRNLYYTQLIIKSKIVSFIRTSYHSMGKTFVDKLNLRK